MLGRVLNANRSSAWSSAWPWSHKPDVEGQHHSQGRTDSYDTFSRAQVMVRLDPLEPQREVELEVELKVAAVVYDSAVILTWCDLLESRGYEPTKAPQSQMRGSWGA
jgi:hypothetical protein